MFEDFFTIYNQVEPPSGFRNVESSDIPEIKSTPISFGSYQQSDIETSDFLSSYNIESPVTDTQPANDSFRFVYPEIKSETNKSETKKSETINLNGPKEFEKVLDQAAEVNPEVNKHRNWLILTAKLESSWQSRPKKKINAPYEGYFGMGHDLIKKLTGLTVEEYLNNPVQQVLAAVKLYNMNLKTVKAMGIYDKCKDKGYSDDAIVAGTWLGGPGGVKKFINGNGDPSDSHWYGGKGGTSVSRRMNEFNNYA